MVKLRELFPKYLYPKDEGGLACHFRPAANLLVSQGSNDPARSNFPVSFIFSHRSLERLQAMVNNSGEALS